MFTELFTVSVGRRNEGGSVYVGRPSPLGNPFYMGAEVNRDLVCDAYEKWFAYNVATGTPKVMAELRKLQAMLEQSDVVLGCYCAPKRCHADTIARYLNSNKRNTARQPP